MIGNGWLQIAIFGAIVVAITKPFGFYMTRVFVGEWTPLSPLLRPVERLVSKPMRRMKSTTRLERSSTTRSSSI
jgi:K+-transporting ATPase A subunit